MAAVENPYEVESVLNLDTDTWSIGEGSFREIVATLKPISPRRILEFGSGMSSVRLALSFQDSEIVSAEGSATYFEKTQELKRRYASTTNLKVIHAPLKFRWSGFGFYLTYSADFDGGLFDGVIIDGPPSFIEGGREACLYSVYDYIPPGGYIFLDDCQRYSEQRAVQNWLKTYPNSFEYSNRESNHHLAILRKMKTVKPKLIVADRIRYNVGCDLRNLISSHERKLGRGNYGRR